MSSTHVKSATGLCQVCCAQTHTYTNTYAAGPIDFVITTQAHLHGHWLAHPSSAPCARCRGVWVGTSASRCPGAHMWTGTMSEWCHRDDAFSGYFPFHFINEVVTLAAVMAKDTHSFPSVDVVSAFQSPSLFISLCFPLSL